MTTLETRRRFARRRMAELAFGSILVKGWTLLLLVAAGWADPEELAAIAPLLGPLTAAEVAVIMSYLGASAYEAVRRDNGSETV